MVGVVANRLRAPSCAVPGPVLLSKATDFCLPILGFILSASYHMSLVVMESISHFFEWKLTMLCSSSDTENRNASSRIATKADAEHGANDPVRKNHAQFTESADMQQDSMAV